MNCKPGDLAVIVNTAAWNQKYLGRFVRIIKAGPTLPFGPTWEVENLPGGLYCEDSALRPIRDQPGNESFVTKARKTLPRAKPVTGPVTINERGEVAATFEQMRRALGRRPA